MSHTVPRHTSTALPQVATRSRDSLRFDELESIRGLAAILVFCNHLPAWNIQIHELSLFRHGGLMVDLFFVLSGFIIHMTYATRITSVRSLAGFQLLRFGRLYPVHALFLFVFVLIEGLKYMSSHHFGTASPNAEVLHQSSLRSFWEHVFLLQAILPLGDILTFNPPSWSISVEFYTYLLFGLITLKIGEGHVWTYLGIHAAMTLMLVSGHFDDFQWLLRCISGFFLGCATSHFMKNKDAGVHWLASECLVVIMVVFVYFKPAEIFDYLIITWLSAALILSIVLKRAGQVGPISHVFRLPWLIYAGTLSYTIYMSHSAVLWFTNQLARYVLHWPEQFVAGSFKPQGALLPAIAMSVFSFALVIVVSMAVTRWVENPSRQYFRRLASGLVS